MPGFGAGSTRATGKDGPHVGFREIGANPLPRSEKTAPPPSPGRGRLRVIRPCDPHEP